MTTCVNHCTYTYIALGDIEEKWKGIYKRKSPVRRLSSYRFHFGPFKFYPATRTFLFIQNLSDVRGLIRPKFCFGKEHELTQY